MAKMHWMVVQGEPKVYCKVIENEKEVLSFSVTRDDLLAMLDAIERHNAEGDSNEQ